ncbi:hypothetical protein P7C70_g8166, partial [Phenoliferia sp. Uapishka_3]
MASPTTASSGISITDVLELPRPQAASPNPSGTLALWPSTTFSFKTNRTEKSISIIDIPSSAVISDEESTPISSSPRKVLSGLSMIDYAWLDDSTFLYLRPEGVAEVGTMDHPEDLSDEAQKKRVKELSGDGVEVWAKDVLEGDEYLVGKLPTACANLTIAMEKAKGSKKQEAAILAFTATVFPDGDPYKVKENEEKAKVAAQGSDVRVYDKIFVRHWDEWKGTSGQLTQVHFVKLTKNPSSALSEDGFELVERIREENEKPKWSFVEQIHALTKGGKRIEIRSPLA